MIGGFDGADSYEKIASRAWLLANMVLMLGAGFGLVGLADHFRFSVEDAKQSQLKSIYGSQQCAIDDFDGLSQTYRRRSVDYKESQRRLFYPLLAWIALWLWVTHRLLVPVKAAEHHINRIRDDDDTNQVAAINTEEFSALYEAFKVLAVRRLNFVLLISAAAAIGVLGLGWYWWLLELKYQEGLTVFLADYC